MGELSQELRRQLQAFSPEGLRASDLLEFPPAVRRIIRLLLQKGEQSYRELSAAVHELPDDQRISQNDLDEILEALADFGWISRTDRSEEAFYQVTLGHIHGERPGTPTRPRREISEATQRVWDALDSRPEEFDVNTRELAAVRPTRTGGSSQVDSLLSGLSGEQTKTPEQAEDDAEAEPLTPARPGVLQRVLRIQTGEVRVVLSLALMLFFNAIAIEVAGVVSVSGFLSVSESYNLLLVWVVDMAIITVASAFQSLIIDRFDRVNLFRWMAFTFGLAYVLLRLLFSFNAPGWLNYSLLYLLGDLQYLFFPLIFWILAADIFSIAQSKRLFPLLAAGGFAGQLFGLGLTVIAPEFASQMEAMASDLLILNAALYLLAFVVAAGMLRGVRLRQTSAKRETAREALTEGWAFIREVPAFKYLTIAILLMTITDTMIEFRFLRVADIVFPSPDHYQQFYGLYRLGVVLAAFAIQMLLTSRIIDKLGLKNSFLVMPVALLAGAAIMLVSPGLGAATTAMVLMRLTRDTVDDSALKAFNGLVPEERRGRVSMFIESYVVAAAVILGCLLAGVIVFIGIRFSFRSYHVAYLVLGGLASVAAIWAVSRMRSVYDSSMFSWRLKRRQRAASVLDKLDF